MADYTLKCTGEQLDAAVEKANSAFVALNNKLNKDDVYDGLDSEDASKALSARQGKLLKNWVDNCITYNEDIDIGNHSFTIGRVFTVGSESSVYTQTTPGSIILKNPIGTLNIGTYSLTVNGTTIYWPTLSADPNGKYLALRSDIPSIDDHLSSTSTNAVQNKVVNSTISELSYQLAMVRENLFQTVLSEIDYTEDFATLYAIPDTLSDTDGTHRVLFSETQLREVAGNSVAFNQNAILTRNNVTIRGITFVNNGDETLSISGTSEKEENFVVGTFKLVQGHKYLAKTRFISGSPTDTTYYIKWSTISYGVDVGNGLLFTATSSNDSAYILFTIYASNVSIDCKISLNVFDLTLIGLDSVSTVEEAKSELLKRGIDIDQYNPYSEGEIRNTTASGLKVNGYNLFDEETETGTYDVTTGEKKADDRQIRSKNDIEIFPGNTYMMEYDGNKENVYIWAGLLDENKTIINGSLWGKNFSIATNFRRIAGSHIQATGFVVPSNARYLRFYFTSPYGSVYKNDTCFHLLTQKAGYAPYKEPKAISFASTELLGAGEAHDTIEVVEGDKIAGIQRYNLVHVKRIGTVDLGTLNWNIADISTNRSFVHFPGAKLFDNDKVANIVSSRFKADTYDDVGSNMSGLETISLGKIGENSYLYVKTSLITASTDTTEKIKTAMSGIALNYELATPTRTTIAENLTFEEVSATIEQGGSIETVYETLAPNCTTGFVVKKAKE